MKERTWGHPQDGVTLELFPVMAYNRPTGEFVVKKAYWEDIEGGWLQPTYSMVESETVFQGSSFEKAFAAAEKLAAELNLN